MECFPCELFGNAGAWFENPPSIFTGILVFGVYAPKMPSSN
jgi:hypothetical protein